METQTKSSSSYAIQEWFTKLNFTFHFPIDITSICNHMELIVAHLEVAHFNNFGLRLPSKEQVLLHFIIA